MELLTRCLNWGADDYNSALIRAAMHCHYLIANQMVKLGANCYDDAMEWAARSGCQIIVDQMLELGAGKCPYKRTPTKTDSYSSAMVAAAKYGHENIVNQMLDLMNDKMLPECDTSYRLLMERKYVYEKALKYASKGEHWEIFDRMDILITNLDDIIYCQDL